MKNICPLDARLFAVYNFVRRGKSVVDIGTDHAQIPCRLWQEGWTDIIASDINEKPLLSAQKTLDKHNVDCVKLILSNGFENIPPRDDIIIAGMGGETIAEILSGCKYKSNDTRFILQPMTRHETLRCELYRLGFEIIEEAFAGCNDKAYTVILSRYTGIEQKTDDAFAFIGKQKNPLYIKSRLKQLEKLAKGDPYYNIIAEKIKTELKTIFDK